MITAGLTAVAALAYRYDDDTPIELALDRAGRRDRHAPASGWSRWPRAGPARSPRPSSTTVGHPDADPHRHRRRPGRRGPGAVDATRSGSPATDAAEPVPGGQAPQHRHAPAPSTTSASTTLSLSAATARRPSRSTLRQDSFGVPGLVDGPAPRGRRTPRSPTASGARLDVRANGDLVGSTDARRRRDVRHRRHGPGRQAALGQRAPAHPQRRRPGRLGLHAAVDPAGRGRPRHRGARRVTVDARHRAGRGLPALPAGLRGHPPGGAAQRRGPPGQSPRSTPPR